ncbi:hypothetical protein ACO1O0_004453 [Amphichorda felina]
MVPAGPRDVSASADPGAPDTVAPMSTAMGDSLTKIPHILPHERVFPIQIGGKLFKLSGASLSSDGSLPSLSSPLQLSWPESPIANLPRPAPSYFSQYFLCQIKTAEQNGDDPCSNIKTLYIDRDPETFHDIALHLQGYYVSPRDGTHFVRLFADAQFYTLPKLISRLHEESIFISIGHREFQIPRDLFSDPGNSPNFFSLGFGAFFSRPDDLFPGLDREGLIRPPSIVPPSVPNRNADTFAEIIRLLRGYPVSIRDEKHRAELLRDVRYFHFKGLEQRLIAHSISFNQARQRDEIALRLESIQKSGISVPPSHPDEAGDDPATAVRWVNYARPFVDDRPAELVLEIGGEATKIHFSSSGSSSSPPRAEFFRDTKARVARLFEVIATKLNLPPTTQPLGLLMAAGGAGSQPATPGNTPLSEDLVRVSLPPEAAIVLDGKEYVEDPVAAAAGQEEFSSAVAHNPRKRRRTEGSEAWIVRTGQWRLRIQPARGGKSAYECVLVAVKLDAVSSELGRNMARGFLCA